MMFDNVEDFKSEVLSTMNHLQGKLAKIHKLSGGAFVAEHSDELRRITAAVNHLINKVGEESGQSLDRREAHQAVYETGVYIGEIICITEILLDFIGEHSDTHQELNVILQESERLFSLRGDTLLELTNYSR